MSSEMRTPDPGAHAHGPWVDVHAHPGACFLRGAPADLPFVVALGGDRSEQSVGRIQAGGVSAVSFATVADLAVIGVRADGSLGASRDFEPGEAAATHTIQLDAIAGLTEVTDLAPVHHPDDVVRLHADGGVGLWLTCEGGDFIESDLDRVAASHERGVRSVTLVHYRAGEIGDIQTEDPRHGGLTGLGREVIAEMNRLGMIVDLAHATFDTTVDAVEASSRPVMISHSHLASPGSDHPRLLSEDHARAVADTGGLIGAWPAGIVAATLNDFVDEICRLIDVVGVGSVAVGSDMDANYRPVLTDYLQFPDLARLLADRGLNSQDRDAVLGGNFLALWRAVIA